MAGKSNPGSKPKPKPKPKPKLDIKLAELPQSTDSWVFAIRLLRMWISPPGQQSYRPYALIAMSVETGLILGISVEEKPDLPGVKEFLFNVMSNPPKQMKIKPHRPSQILFEDKERMEALSNDLQAIGVEVAHQPSAAEIDEMLKEMEDHLRGGNPQVPGLLSQGKIDPALIGSLFSAAVDFYRAQPWIQLSNEDVLSIQVPFRKKPYFVIVMGQGGIEYGLALYQNWEAVEKAFIPQERPEDIIPPGGVQSLMFNEAVDTPFDDLEAIEKYGWEIAGPEAYPVPVIYHASGKLTRPGRDGLLQYEAALRAIPEFVREHLVVDASGQIQPSQAQISVPLSTGPAVVEIKIPVGELPKPVNRPDVLDLFAEEDDQHEEIPLPFDRRAMEAGMARMFGMSSGLDLDPKLEKAQEMMYRAWEEANPARRIALAHKALTISPDCADAYVLLAEEEADTVERALDLYRQGVEAGERALGKDYFQENAGDFWGLVETRPYMRAMEGLASCLWQVGQKEKSLGVYQEMLRLNPGDNQGIRYVLADLLLKLNRYAELEKLLDEYHGDGSAVWLYTEALLKFRNEGATREAKAALQAALDANRYVPEYLSGKKRIPNRIPELIGFGEDSEAVVYAANHLNYWRRTPGAVDWLQGQQAQAPIKTRHSRGGKRGKSGKKGVHIQVGDSVMVQPGVADPDFGQDVSGWQGRVIEIDEDEPQPLVTIRWDSQTLQQMPASMIEQCEQEMLEWGDMILALDEVRRVDARDTEEERQVVYQKMEARHAWDFLGEQGGRIRDVLKGVDANDEQAALETWERFLREHLKFPFQAEVVDDIGDPDFEGGDTLKVAGVEGVDETEGVMVQVIKGRLHGVIPLFALEVVNEQSANADYVDDYNAWFAEV